MKTLPLLVQSFCPLERSTYGHKVGEQILEERAMLKEEGLHLENVAGNMNSGIAEDSSLLSQTRERAPLYLSG